jgi:hypothetical protein
VAQIGRPTDKPTREWWIAVIADLLGCGIPVYELGLLSPKDIPIFYRAFVKVCVGGHYVSPFGSLKLNS